MPNKLSPAEAAHAVQTIVNLMAELGWYMTVVYATDGSHALKSTLPGWTAERLEKMIKENAMLEEVIYGDGDGGTIQ